MIKLSLVALFAMTMATLTLAASILPAPPKVAGSMIVLVAEAN